MARPSSAAGREAELAIHGLTSSGEGVGRLPDGRVVFVRGAFPGDQALVRLTDEQERLAHGEVLRLTTPSTRRVRSACEVAACGGCALRGYDDRAQGDAKADQVLQAMRRIAKLDAGDVFGGIQSGPPWHYRHRVRLHARHEGRWRIGYHARGSHALVPIESCPVLWPELEGQVLALADWLADKPASAKVREIEVAASRLDGRAALHIVADGELDLTGAPMGGGTLRYDQPRPFALHFTPDVFTQANPEMNLRLVDAVLGAVTGERVLELHSGIGNFSLPLAAAGRAVRAVEESSRASSLARSNAEGAGLAITTVTGSDSAAVADADAVDVVLLDPPRIGARDVAAALASRGPKRVVYVSCDPATLARDVRLLVDGGYALASLVAFDMFPQTPHVESLAVLTRS